MDGEFSTLVRVEKLFSHVAVEIPMVKAVAYKEKMFGKASLNCNIICAALANVVSLEFLQ